MACYVFLELDLTECIILTFSLLCGLLLFHKMREWLGLEGTSRDHPVQPPAKTGLARAGCTGTHPVRF